MNQSNVGVFLMTNKFICFSSNTYPLLMALLVTKKDQKLFDRLFLPQFLSKSFASLRGQEGR